MASLVLSALLADSPATEIPRGVLLGDLTAGGETLRYAVYVPREFDAARRWPLVLSLHGQGECGTDGLRQLTQGLSQAILAAPQEWPVIALFPQKPDPEREWEEYEPALMALVEAARARWPIDPDRVYLTGLSQGGHGAWVLGARHAELWAAVVPVCGYVAAREGDPRAVLPGGAYNGSPGELAKSLRTLPIWAFHGVADSIVPVAETESMIAALVTAGGNPKLTLFPGVDHGSWDPAYRDSGLSAWLLAQRRPPRSPEETPR
jgi:predicted peptidase